jgi:diguanylate cyclase (GGDEF)-like protein
MSSAHAPTGHAESGLRLNGRLDQPSEADYHRRKFDELRQYTGRTLLALALLIVGLWAWDWAIDPVAAPRTLWLRLGMAACLLPCIVAIRAPAVTPGQFTGLLYAAVLATQVFWISIVRRLSGGVELGNGGWMFYVLGVLVVGLPLRFRDNVLGLTLSLLVPNLAAAAGWLPGFSVVRFNTLLLPAGALSLYSTWAFDRLYRRLVRYQYDMEALAGEDALTGLPNRRQFMKAGEQMLEQVRRYGRAASLLLIDLDHFNTINDRYGHAAGDAVLRVVAGLLLKHQRGADLPARLGGEEFAMLLPETDLAGAVAQAERLRAACEALRVDLPGGVFAPVSLTMSLGAAGCGPDDRSLDDVLRRADGAMYHAKHGGRNRVEREE